MLFRKHISVELLQEIDVRKYHWCESAVLFRVKNGMNALCVNVGNWGKYWDYSMQILLNGKPLMQAKLNGCPTCSGMLAAGYGIENSNCPELKQISDAINAEYIDIQDSFRKLKPLLGLLPDGYYLLADILHYPTDGENHFFWNASSDFRKMRAVCEEYYHEENLNQTERFPAFLYPTQSDRQFQPERAAYYQKLMQNANAPRAITYHATGFISILLDGHHKAYACAKMGISVPCLTIIQPDTVSFYQNQHYADFAGIRINTKEIPDFVRLTANPKQFQMQKYDLIQKGFSDADFNKLKYYPDMDEISDLDAVNLLSVRITPEQAKQWLNFEINIDHPDYDEITKAYIRLKCALRYFRRTDPEYCLALSKKILSSDHVSGSLTELIYTLLVDYKTSETEQLFLNAIVQTDLPNGKKNNLLWNIITSYWEDIC